jgi:hypothetical protein
MGILPREANYVGQNQSTRLTPAQSRRTKHKENLGATGGPLLSQQFTPMNTIKRAYAVDVAGTVGKDLIPEKQRQVEAGEGDTADYPLLVDTMKKQGVNSIPPVHFGTVDSMNHDYGPGIGHFNSLHLVGKGNAPALGNGGHRTAIASDLGWKVMRSTPDKSESGYKETKYGAGDSEYGESGYSSGSSDHSSEWRDSSGSGNNTNASYSMQNAAAAAGSEMGHSTASRVVHAYSPGTPQPGDRSFVPMQDSYGNQVGGADPGARWHADGKDGSKPAGQGLYSRIHPLMNQPAANAPLTNHLNSQQFAGTVAGLGTETREQHNNMAIYKNNEDVLPGMHMGNPDAVQRFGVAPAYTGGNAEHGSTFAARHGAQLPSLSQALVQARARLHGGQA